MKTELKHHHTFTYFHTNVCACHLLFNSSALALQRWLACHPIFVATAAQAVTTDVTVTSSASLSYHVIEHDDGAYVVPGPLRERNNVHDMLPTGFRIRTACIRAGSAKKPIIRQSGISLERQWPTANWAYPRNQLDTVVILSPPA